MLFPSLLNRLFPAVLAGRRLSQRRPRLLAKRPPVQLHLEAMEARWLLSQVTGTPAVINYAGGIENVFVVGSDYQDLHVNHYNPRSGWSWLNLGNPGARINSDPAAINYGSQDQYENVFLIGDDGNLYVDHWSPSSGWSWLNQGKPSSAVNGLIGGAAPAVINYGNGYENVFVTAFDNLKHENLYVDHYDPSGGWSWINLGNPGGIPDQYGYIWAFKSGPSAINYGSFFSQHDENVFLTGIHGDLVVDHFDPGSGWSWYNQGNPGVGLDFGYPTAINYGTNGQYENVFITGLDGNLYVDHYAPGSGWSWSNQGNPGRDVGSTLAAINYGSTGQYENVFSTGGNGHLYVDHYDPSVGWGWLDQGNPGVGVAYGPAVINYPGGSENVFVVGSDGNLYLKVDVFNWTWFNHGQPASGQAQAPPGAGNQRSPLELAQPMEQSRAVPGIASEAAQTSSAATPEDLLFADQTNQELFAGPLDSMSLSDLSLLAGPRSAAQPLCG